MFEVAKIVYRHEHYDLHYGRLRSAVKGIWIAFNSLLEFRGEARAKFIAELRLYDALMEEIRSL